MPAYHIICTSFSRDYRDYHGCFHPSEADGPNLHLQLPWLHSILGPREAYDCGVTVHAKWQQHHCLVVKLTPKKKLDAEKKIKR